MADDMQQPPQDRPAIHAQGVMPPPPPPPQAPGPMPAGSMGYPMMYPPTPPRKERAVLTRIVTGVLTSLVLLSLLANVYLGIFFFQSVAGTLESVYQEGDATNRIVILPIKGMIDDTTSGFVQRALRQLDKNPPRALILRIDSPGGSVSASDRIWYQLTQFKKKHKLPVVASFGALAASGGYYVAAPSDVILSEPMTITGSIGVIAQAFTVQELLNKVGVTPEVIVSSKSVNKDGLNPMRAWTEKDRNELRIILDKAYERFVNVVAEGRASKLTREEVEKLATGAPYTTDEALNLKLVDEEGFIDAAITRATELAKLGSDVQPQVSVVSERTGGLLSLISGSTSVAPMGLMWDTAQIRRWTGELTTPTLEYRMVP